MQPRVSRVEAAAHAHATEDPRRVLEALLSIVPPELRGSVRVEESTLEGHYNNPIVRLRLVLEGEAAERAVRWIASRLSEEDKRLLAGLFESRYDGRRGRLYMRLGKQEAYMGELRLRDGDDVILVVIHLRGSPPAGKASETLRGLGLIP